VNSREYNPYAAAAGHNVVTDNYIEENDNHPSGLDVNMGDISDIVGGGSDRSFHDMED